MIPPAPPSILAADGTPLYGVYAGTVQDTSLRGATGVSPILRALGQKRWIFVGIYGPRLVAGVAVIDLTYVCSAFAFAFDRLEGRLFDHNLTGPRLRQAVPDSPAAGSARFQRGGSLVEIASDPVAGERVVRARVGRGDRRLELDAVVEEGLLSDTPLSLVAPVPGGRFTFTHKAAGLRARGSVIIGRRKIALEDARAAVDYTHGLPARRTRWLWASAAGTSACGRRLGFNLVSGWNEEPESENAAWLDGRLLKLGRARFWRDSTCWTVECDRLSARFYPEAVRRRSVSLAVVATRYLQPLGRFEGYLEDEDGSQLSFESLPGVTEEHDALW